MQSDALPAEAVAADSVLEVAPDMVDQLDAASSSLDGAEELVEDPGEFRDVAVFPPCNSLPTLDASAAHRDNKFSRGSTVPDVCLSSDGISAGEPDDELVLTLESAGAVADSAEVLPEHGKLVLATPQMQAPEIQSKCALFLFDWFTA